TSTDPLSTAIYTLSLHDALPICNLVETLVREGISDSQPGARRDIRFGVASNPEFLREGCAVSDSLYPDRIVVGTSDSETLATMRSEEHTSELQSRGHLVCRLLLE